MPAGPLPGLGGDLCRCRWVLRMCKLWDRLTGWSNPSGKIQLSISLGQLKWERTRLVAPTSVIRPQDSVPSGKRTLNQSRLCTGRQRDDILRRRQTPSLITAAAGAGADMSSPWIDTTWLGVDASRTSSLGMISALRDARDTGRGADMR